MSLCTYSFHRLVFSIKSQVEVCLREVREASQLEIPILMKTLSAWTSIGSSDSEAQSLLDPSLRVSNDRQ